MTGSDVIETIYEKGEIGDIKGRLRSLATYLYVSLNVYVCKCVFLFFLMSPRTLFIPWDKYKLFKFNHVFTPIPSEVIFISHPPCPSEQFTGTNLCPDSITISFINPWPVTRVVRSSTYTKCKKSLCLESFFIEIKFIISSLKCMTSHQNYFILSGFGRNKVIAATENRFLRICILYINITYKLFWIWRIMINQ